jgi:hypothetical protein
MVSRRTGYQRSYRVGWIALALISLAAALLALAGVPAWGQGPGLTNQHFEVTPEPARSHVGDSVTLRFRVRLDERDLLYDTVPKPVADLPEGERVLAVEKLRRGADRIYTGRALVAFYRTGRQAAPVFGLPFMRAVKGVTRAMLTSDSAFIDIDPVAPPGNPTLKDIKEIERQRGPDPRLVLLLLGAAGLTAGLLVLRRRGRRGALAAPAPDADDIDPIVLGPYEVALARLTQIDRERWPLRGEVDRHYEAVADVIRRYLEEAHGVPALERTTTELTWALPPLLADDGLRDRCAAILADADLVKFARRRPDEADAGRLLRAARDLLGAWRTAGPDVRETEDALR